MARLARLTATLGLGALGLSTWIGGCSDGRRVTDPVTPDSAIVSEAVPNASFAGEASRGDGAASLAAASGAADETDVAYVSLPAGMIRNGTAATISNRRTESSVTLLVTEGGFDPVPVPAHAGDALDLVVTDGGGAAVYSATIKVPVRRPPKVVRTIPPKGKTDVPLNARIIVVFSEPVDGSTLTTASVRLMRGTTAVAGTVRFLDPTLDATRVSVEFVPTRPLDPRAQYQLTVTRDVRDLSGEPLPAAETVTFTTGASSAGPPASLRLWPDSLLDLVTGATYQMTAMVQDAAGSVLTDKPVTWSSSDPDALAVSPTGLLTALADGTYQITAGVDGLRRVLTVFVRAGPPASVSVAPTPATVAAGDTIILAATVRDAAGRAIRHPSVTWASSAPAVATAAPYNDGNPGGALGTITGVSPGTVMVTATSGTASGTATVTVGSPRPVASVTVTPGSATLIVQGKARLVATLRDASGRTISGRPITWTSNNAPVATVDANGLVTGVSTGSAAVTAMSEGVSSVAAITVTTLTFESLTAGFEHTCGVTTDGVAYCWGDNSFGQLGNDLPPEVSCPEGSDNPNCGAYAPEYYYGSYLPAPVNGGLTFSALSAGGLHTCGLTAVGAAYCWGWASGGRLGLASNTAPDRCGRELRFGSCSLAPMPVAGGLTFDALTASPSGDWRDSDVGHTCSLTTSGAAYCWGGNWLGQLGRGSTGGDHPVPAAVTGGLTFAALHLGSMHTCGLTPSGTAYCWGDDRFGQLGTGSSGGSSPVPVIVSGGLTFAALSAGSFHTCGLTTSGAAYCWGLNNGGQLGNGSSASPDPLRDFSPLPAPVAGGLTFAALSGGGWHTCALTPGGAAYCWGWNWFGQLGIGSSSSPDQCFRNGLPCSRRPLAVAGGLSFATLSAGGLHTCGLTKDRVAYCWGPPGPVGDVNGGGGNAPVKVAGQP